MQQASARAASSGPRSLLKECLEAARRGGQANGACPPSAEQEAGFLAGLEVASIVGAGGGASSGRVSRTVSFANLSPSSLSTPRSSPPPPRQHPRQQLPPSSLGVSPPLRPSVPLPPTTATGSLVSSPTFASSMQQQSMQQQQHSQQQQSQQQQQRRRCSSASSSRANSASSSQRQEQHA